MKKVWTLSLLITIFFTGQPTESQVSTKSMFMKVRVWGADDSEGKRIANLIKYNMRIGLMQWEDIKVVDRLGRNPDELTSDIYIVDITFRQQRTKKGVSTGVVAISAVLMKWRDICYCWRGNWLYFYETHNLKEACDLIASKINRQIR